MNSDTYLDAIARESEHFALALEDHPSLPVPTCPGWQVADVGVHLGIIHRWAEEMVRTGASQRLEHRVERFGIDPGDPGLVEWFRTGAHELHSTLAHFPREKPVWSWTTNSTTAFWQRRQAHETTVHRWDVENVTGRTHVIDPLLGTDGIDEFLNVFAVASSRARSSRVGNGESFNFHCTDSTGRWTVRFDGPGIEVNPGIGVKTNEVGADVVLRGSSEALLLFLWGRCSSQDLDVTGDSALLDTWLEFVPV